MVITVIITALQTEAAPIIAHYGLKKDLSSHGFPVFVRDNVLLCVVGKNAAVAAAAVGYVFGRWGITKTDEAWLLHTGICATDQIRGGMRTGWCTDAALCQCRQAVLVPHTVVSTMETAMGRAFYPELAYRHPFVEAMLIDPVADAVLRAAAKFLPLHRIIAAKGIESDQSVAILAWFTRLIATVADEAPASGDVSHNNALFSERERYTIDETAKRLRLTHSMRILLEEACVVYKVADNKVADNNDGLITLLSAENKTPCATKQEGKMSLARLRQQLMRKHKQ